MVDAPVESDSPPDLCDGSSCVLSQCVLRERVYGFLAVEPRVGESHGRCSGGK